MQTNDPVRYALIGLGNIAQTAVIPGFEQAAHSKLVALVTSDPIKRAELAARHGVTTTGGYDDLEGVLARSQADAAYIAVPNHLHRAFTERCAVAGVHVICEKPMALTSDDCAIMEQEMRGANRKLMIAYRLHFDPANLEVIDLIRSGRMGEARVVLATLTHQIRAHDIRTRAEAGGGALYDAAVYPINAARYLFADEPIEVFGYMIEGTSRMPDVDATTVAIIRFSGGRFCQLSVSQRAAAVSSYRVIGEIGEVTLEHAFTYDVPMRLEGTIAGQMVSHAFERHDQFGAEIEYFSRCILEDREPEPNGEEGLADVRVIEAIAESARRGRPIRLEPFHRERRPEPEQVIAKPGVEEPKPVHAPPPQIG